MKGAEISKKRGPVESVLSYDFYDGKDVGGYEARGQIHRPYWQQ